MLRRRRDPYHVGPDLEWVGAAVAALVIVALIAYLMVRFLLVAD